MLEEALEDVRDLSHLLYPSIIEHIGLEKAISSVVSKGLYGTDIKYSVDIPTLNVSKELELLLYRAAQEFVNNMLKHSDANVFDLAIEAKSFSNEVIITATDNGAEPFTVKEFAFGLNMLKQQAALFDGDLHTQRAANGLNMITLNIFDNQ